MKDNKKIIIIGIFICVIVFGSILINNLTKNKEIKESKTVTITETKKTTTKTVEKIVVEIKGEVYFPGVYEFTKDEVLIMDVINIAGGLTPKADTSLINSAEIVKNHMSITIGTKGKGSYINEDGYETSKININTCSKEDLMTLEGIGEVRANKIISYRKTNGFYNNIKNLTEYGLISEALFEKIKDYITV